MLYYMSGYVAKKEKMYSSDEYDTSALPESDFTLQLSRGNLQLPPIDLYDLSLYCFSFFKLREVKCCTKIFLQAFQQILIVCKYDFPTGVLRRFINCFLKMYCNQARDRIRTLKDKRETKRRRISSRL